MPKLERSQWYDLSRDMNWNFKYVTEEEVFPDVLSQSHGIPAATWWNWDEPYKISYREYVHNQAAKDAEVYSVRSAIARSRLFEHLDPGWKSTLIAHYGTSAIPSTWPLSARPAWDGLGAPRPGVTWLCTVR